MPDASSAAPRYLHVPLRPCLHWAPAGTTTSATGTPWGSNGGVNISSRTPDTEGSIGGSFQTVIVPVKRSTSSPGGVDSREIASRESLMLTPPALPSHGSMASQMPSQSRSTSRQLVEQQLSAPFAAPWSQSSPGSTTPSPQAARTGSAAAPTPASSSMAKSIRHATGAAIRSPRAPGCSYPVAQYRPSTL